MIAIIEFGFHTKRTTPINSTDCECYRNTREVISCCKLDDDVFMHAVVDFLRKVLKSLSHPVEAREAKPLVFNF